MHRVEAIPVFSYLDFLYEEAAVRAEPGIKEE
jgi:hypothetical protein